MSFKTLRPVLQSALLTRVGITSVSERSAPPISGEGNAWISRLGFEAKGEQHNPARRMPQGQQELHQAD